MPERFRAPPQRPLFAPSAAESTWMLRPSAPAEYVPRPMVWRTRAVKSGAWSLSERNGVEVPCTAITDSGLSADTDQSPLAQGCVHRNCAWRTKSSPPGPQNSRVFMYACSLKKLAHVGRVSSLQSEP